MAIRGLLICMDQTTQKPPVRDQAATMRQHASAAPDRGAARPGTETTSTLVAAIAAQLQKIVDDANATKDPDKMRFNQTLEQVEMADPDAA